MSCQFSCLQNVGNKLYCFGLTVNMYQRLKGKKLSPKCTCWLLDGFIFLLEPLIFILASKWLSWSKFWLASSSVAAWFYFCLWPRCDWNLIFYSVWCEFSFKSDILFCMMIDVRVLTEIWYFILCGVGVQKESDFYSVWCQSFAWNQAFTLSCSFMNSC